MDKLKLLKLQEEQDCEEMDERELEEKTQQDKNNFREKYFEFYDDVKQPCKNIKEDW